MAFYALRGRTSVKWGDYGDMLQHGMTMHLPRSDGRLQLERTAPYVPPISVNLHVLVTEDAKHRIEDSQLSGWSFIPVYKARIVHLPWETWDLAAEEPAVYPDTGEPEDYILQRPHDQAAADQIGTIYELVVRETARVRRVPAAESATGRPILLADSWNGNDFFRAEGVMTTYVTERAKQWLQAAFPGHVAFEPA